MEMEPMSLLASLLPGIIGGNIGGLLVGRRGFGVIGNTIAGIIGGLGGGQGLEAMGGLDIAAITQTIVDLGSKVGIDLSGKATEIAGGGIGGLVLGLLTGLRKR